MKPPLSLLTPSTSLSLLPRTHNPISHQNLNPFRTRSTSSSSSSSCSISVNSQFNKPSKRFFTVRSSSSDSNSKSNEESTTINAACEEEVQPESRWNVEVGQPNVTPSYFPEMAKLSLSDKAFFLLAFIACTTSVAFTSLVIAAVPTLFAMGRAAKSLSKLADTAREELPSTMAAIRLSGMEISDLTLELSDLSHEIADGVSKSAQAVQAAEAGIRKIGSLARHQTASMIEERANLPDISLQPVVVGAAKKTSHAVGQATKSFLAIISRGEFNAKKEDGNTVDRLDI